MKFIFILEKRPYKEKELTYIKNIYSFDEDIYKTLTNEYSPSSIKIVELEDGLDLPYMVNDAMEWYDLNHNRKSDYECWLLDIKDAVDGCTYDIDGNLVMMTDYQKKLAGKMNLDEGTYIKDGKIYKDGLYQLKKDYGKEFKDFYRNISSLIEGNYRQDYTNVNKLIEYQGISYQVSQDSVNILNSLINSNNSSDIIWRDYSNKMNSLTKEDASALLAKMNEFLQNDKLIYWEIKDWAEKEYNKKPTLEAFISKLKKKIVEVRKIKSSDLGNIFVDTEVENTMVNEPINKKELKDNLNTFTTEEAISLRKKIVNRY